MQLPRIEVTPDQLLEVVGELYPLQLEVAMRTLEARRLREWIGGLPDPQPGQDGADV